MFPLYDWYNLNGQLIRRKFCVLRKNQTSARLRGDREGWGGIERLILRITKIVIYKSDYYRGGCAILIVCQISFLKQCRSHSWFYQKDLSKNN